MRVSREAAIISSTLTSVKEQMEHRINWCGAREMLHSKSDDLLGMISRSSSPSIDLPVTTSEDDLIAVSGLRDSRIYDETISDMSFARRSHRVPPLRGVSVDPEDSIRDIVSEDDLYRSAK
jgi:hypothetical protein